MSILKTTKEHKYFGKKWSMETDRLDVLALFIGILALGCYTVYLNFAAIGNVIAAGTGIHPFVAFLLLFALTYIVQRIFKSNGVSKAISSAIWITMGVIGMYWVLTTSDWAIYEKVLLIVANIISYINLIMNKFSTDD